MGDVFLMEDAQVQQFGVASWPDDEEVVYDGNDQRPWVERTHRLQLLYLHVVKPQISQR